MSFLKAFGSYLPHRVVTNEELGRLLGCDSIWIKDVSGIEERRYADKTECVADLGTKAAENCLYRARLDPQSVGMVILASGSAERRFPGPAVTVARQLGITSAPAIDLSMASSGSLFGLFLADHLAPSFGNILVIGAEKMSSLLRYEPAERNITVLFGDGAGACLVSANEGRAEIVGSVLHSDGTFTEDLRLEYNAPLTMNGRTVILHAARKIPDVINEVLNKYNRKMDDVDIFIIHQANQNLLAKIGEVIGVDHEKIYSNIRTMGNTSSASMLIAAADWEKEYGFRPGGVVVFAAFGAGFHWGALMVVGTSE